MPGVCGWCRSAKRAVTPTMVFGMNSRAIHVQIGCDNHKKKFRSLLRKFPCHSTLFFRNPRDRKQVLHDSKSWHWRETTAQPQQIGAECCHPYLRTGHQTSHRWYSRSALLKCISPGACWILAILTLCWNQTYSGTMPWPSCSSWANRGHVRQEGPCIQESIWINNNLFCTHERMYVHARM